VVFKENRLAAQQAKVGKALSLTTKQIISIQITTKAQRRQKHPGPPLTGLYGKANYLDLG